MWYFQYVENHRKDLVGLFPLITPDPAYANVGRVLDQALASERPVYLIKSMDGLDLKADITPEGALFRATPSKTTPFYTRNLTLPYIAVPTPNGKVVTETVELRGYDLSAPSVQPGQTLAVTLYWQPPQPLTVDYTSYVHVVNEAGALIAQSDHQPGGEYYPSSHWQARETLRDRHMITIPQDTPSGVYHLRLGMYYRSAPGIVSGMGNGVTAGAVAVKDKESTITTQPDNLSERGPRFVFGDQVLLLGYDVIPTRENQLSVILTWQATQILNTNWSVFAHLLDSDGKIIAQADSQPRGGSYPTTVWDVDEIVNDALILSIPDTTGQAFELAVGLYDPETGNRLLISNENGDVLGDVLKLKISL